MSRKLDHPRPQETELNAFKRMEREVNWLELTIRKNNAQKALTGMTIDSHLESFVSIEGHITQNHPEVLPGLIEERNVFLQQIGFDEKDYLKMLEQDKLGRQRMQQNQDPGEALHAIHDEIAGQQEEPESEEPADQGFVEHPDAQTFNLPGLKKEKV